MPPRPKVLAVPLQKSRVSGYGHQASLVHAARFFRFQVSDPGLRGLGFEGLERSEARCLQPRGTTTSWPLEFKKLVCLITCLELLECYTNMHLRTKPCAASKMHPIQR